MQGVRGSSLVRGVTALGVCRSLPPCVGAFGMEGCGQCAGGNGRGDEWVWVVVFGMPVRLVVAGWGSGLFVCWVWWARDTDPATKGRTWGREKGFPVPPFHRLEGDGDMAGFFG